MLTKEVMDRASEVRMGPRQMEVSARQVIVLAKEIGFSLVHYATGSGLMVRSAMVRTRVGAREEAIRNNVESNWSQAPSKQI